MPRIALLALLAALPIAACGDDDSTSGASTSTGSPTATSTPSTTATSGGASGAQPAEEGGSEAAAEDPALTRDQVITAVLTGSEAPALTCDALVTERFVRQAYGARQGCIAALSAGSLARSVEIGTVGEAGGRATATVVPTGGPYDGVEVKVELVTDPARDNAWQVDSLFADVPAGP